MWLCGRNPGRVKTTDRWGQSFSGGHLHFRLGLGQAAARRRPTHAHGRHQERQVPPSVRGQSPGRPREHGSGLVTTPRRSKLRLSEVEVLGRGGADTPVYPGMGRNSQKPPKRPSPALPPSLARAVRPSVVCVAGLRSRAEGGPPGKGSRSNSPFLLCGRWTGLGKHPTAQLAPAVAQQGRGPRPEALRSS